MWRRELYEGDILRVITMRKSSINSPEVYPYLDVTGVVTRDSIGTMIGDVRLSRFLNAEKTFMNPDIKYLGNKFENPELLEEIE
ncbi:TPA: YopX family protein [Staphylococcus aureus]